MRLVVALLTALSLSPSSKAAVVTFEELVNLGTAPVAVGELGGLDFGTLGAFDALDTSFPHLTDTPRNAAFIERSVTYTISRSGGGTFDFIGADFARSHVDSALYQFAGTKNGQKFFTAEVNAELGFPDHQRITLNWTAIDALQITFGPPVTTGFAAMDNFEFELTPVPLPAAGPMFGLAALALAWRKTRRA